MVQDRSISNKIIDGAIYTALALITLMTVIPLLYVVSSSVSVRPGFLPTKINISAYRYIFSTIVFIRSLGISVYITVLGTALSLLVSVLMAYSLADKDLPARRFFNFMVVFTTVFSAGMIPTFLVVKATGLLNSLWALMIPTLINAFNLIVLRSFIGNLPEELKEAARIDGCHELILVFKIIIPLSLPSMSTIGLFYAVTKWNTYFQAMLYVSDNTKWPVQVLLRQIIFSVSSSMGDSGSQQIAVAGDAVKYAAIIVSTTPILMIYPYLQKHFAKGVMLGSVKG